MGVCMKYIVLIVAISIIDLVMTIVGMNIGICREANPLLLWFIKIYGLPGFVFAKLILFTALPIFVIEICGRIAKFKRTKINNYYKFTIVVYLLIIGISIIIQLLGGRNALL